MRLKRTASNSRLAQGSTPSLAHQASESIHFGRRHSLNFTPSSNSSASSELSALPRTILRSDTQTEPIAEEPAAQSRKITFVAQKPVHATLKPDNAKRSAIRNRQMPPKHTRSDNQPQRQQSSSHMLKTGRRGNPFCKDTHDLFATLMVSLELKNNSRFFRTYPNSFTTDDAADNLASLRFSQSNRNVDPNDPSRIITTTTTTTFSMSREIAKGICQHFMDARLIQNAADPQAIMFKERGIYQITAKGLHILERFISKNGIASDRLVKVFISQPICMKLLYLERHAADDDIIVSRSVVDVVFRRFSGSRHPNYVHDATEVNRMPAPRQFIDNFRLPPGFDRSLGVELQDVSERGKNGQTLVYKQVFGSQQAVDWLLDYTTCVCREEAAELLGQFVRVGLIALYQDRSKSGDKLIIVEVKSETSSGGPTSAEFRWGSRVTYRITDEGRRLVSSPAASSVKADVSEVKRASTTDDDASSTSSVTKPVVLTQRLDRSGVNAALSDVLDRQHMTSQLKELFLSDMDNPQSWVKEQSSSTARLRYILDEPMLRGMFREYLRNNYCDENLGFWLDVSEFRRRFSTTSSASGGRIATPSKSAGNATSAMEIHQQHLVAAAMQIYQNYLAPMSPNELNIDHNLRGEVVNFIQKAQLENAASGDQPEPIKKTSDGPGDPEVTSIALRATQVQTLLRHYEKIQDHIFRLLATDQVPKFIRTPRFVALLGSQDENRSSEKTSALKVTASTPKPV